jgi:hypothetical protein
MEGMAGTILLRLHEKTLDVLVLVEPQSASHV